MLKVNYPRWYQSQESLREEALNINLEPLPGYSPDFMPVEHLWQWLREDLTDHTGYQSSSELIDAVANFQFQINEQPIALSDRLGLLNTIGKQGSVTDSP